MSTTGPGVGPPPPPQRPGRVKRMANQAWNASWNWAADRAESTLDRAANGIGNVLDRSALRKKGRSNVRVAKVQGKQNRINEKYAKKAKRAEFGSQGKRKKAFSFMTAGITNAAEGWSAKSIGGKFMTAGVILLFCTGGLGAVVAPLQWINGITAIAKLAVALEIGSTLVRAVQAGRSKAAASQDREDQKIFGPNGPGGGLPLQQQQSVSTARSQTQTPTLTLASSQPSTTTPPTTAQTHVTLPTGCTQEAYTEGAVLQIHAAAANTDVMATAAGIAVGSNRALDQLADAAGVKPADIVRAMKKDPESRGAKLVAAAIEASADSGAPSAGRRLNPTEAASLAAAANGYELLTNGSFSAFTMQTSVGQGHTGLFAALGTALNFSRGSLSGMGAGTTTRPTSRVATTSIGRIA